MMEILVGQVVVVQNMMLYIRLRVSLVNAPMPAGDFQPFSVCKKKLMQVGLCSVPMKQHCLAYGATYLNMMRRL